MSLPDYFIIGAMKCGTTTLAAQLGAQDGVFMSNPKEPNYFSDDAVFAKGLDWYENLFDTAATDDLKGEASTHYSKLPDYPETLARLARVTETPKIIYLIRDPLVRAVSHYIHEWTQGVISSDLDSALQQHPALVAYGRYGDQVTPWVDRFGTDAVLVLTLEGLKSDPQSTLDRVAAHLQTEPLTWQDDLGQVNVSVERIRRLPLQGVILDNPIATWLRRALVPQALRDRVKAARQMQTRPKISPTDRARLETVFTEDFAVLSALFPDRPDLRQAYPFLSDD